MVCTSLRRVVPPTNQEFPRMNKNKSMQHLIFSQWDTGDIFAMGHWHGESEVTSVYSKLVLRRM